MGVVGGEGEEMFLPHRVECQLLYQAIKRSSCPRRDNPMRNAGLRNGNVSQESRVRLGGHTTGGGGGGGGRGGGGGTHSI